MPVVSTTYTGKEQSLAEQDWLILEQADIPQSQQICTVDDLRGMLEQAMIGRSALSYIHEACPVSRRYGVGGVVFAIYSATIFVHRSDALAGKYDLTPSEGDLSLGVKTTRPKDEPYELQYEAFKGLGWLPTTTPEYEWLTTVKDADKIRVFSPKDPDSVNGHLYFDQAYKGTIQVSGDAWVDRYTLTIEHQQGYAFDKSIMLTAEWGPKDIYGNRESAQLKINIPTCVVDEFNKCSTYGFPDTDLIPDRTEPWISSLGHVKKIRYIGRCTGKNLGEKKISE